WARVIAKAALKQRNTLAVLFALIVTLFALGALFSVIDTTRPFLALFSAPYGYALLGGSGLALAIALLLTLLIGIRRDTNVLIEEGMRKAWEAVSDEALRLAILQLLNQ